jgi:hypothetical protein
LLTAGHWIEPQHLLPSLSAPHLLWHSAIVRRFILFAIALLLPAHAMLSVTIYVDRAGNDANPGTSAQPIRTIQALAGRTWGPGDAVYFHAGQTFAGVLRLSGGGSDSHPVIIGAYGGGRATIISTGDAFFDGYNQGGFQFQDLNLKPSFAGPSSSGILFHADSPLGARFPGITILNCDLRGFGGPAVKIGSSQPSNPGWSQIRIDNCRCTASGAGMALYGFDTPNPTGYPIDVLRVTHSEFAANRGTGLSISGVASGVVEYCSFHDNHRVGGCWTWAARHVLIQHCISFRNRRGRDNDGFGFDLDGGSVGCTIQDCLSWQNDTAGFAIFDYPNSADTTGDVIRYCISDNDVRSDREGASFEINSWANTPIRASFIHNCAAYLTSHGGGSICAGFMGIGQQSMYGWQSGVVSGCGFLNNIVYLAGGGGDLVHLYCQQGAVAPSEISYLGNDYASDKSRPPRILADGARYTSLADWRQATNQERLIANGRFVDYGIAADPQCVLIGQIPPVADPAAAAQAKAWRPTPASPCLHSGIDIARQFHIDPGLTDFFGNPIHDAEPAVTGPAGPGSILR